MRSFSITALRAAAGEESVSEGKADVSYFVRKYSYLVVLLLGSFATAKYLRAEHRGVALPPLAAFGLLILLVMLNDGRHRCSWSLS